MAIRVNWDEYEIALLIDACQRCDSGKISKKEVIQNLSATLRNRAAQNGIKIDNVFRDKNGIAMQLILISSLMHRKKCGLNHMSKVFKDMIDLYNSDRKSFEKILMGAKKMADSNNLIQMQYEEWLSTKVSVAQMSELYFAYQEIEAFCLYIKILKKPLFETTDTKTVAAVKQTIDSNKVFRFRYKGKEQRMSFAIKYYYQWVRDNQHLFQKAVTSLLSEATINVISSQNGQRNDVVGNELPLGGSEINFIDFNKYKELLFEKYQKGFRIESGLEMRRFKNFWQEKFGSLLEEHDDMVRKYIRSMTIKYNDFVYLPEIMISADTKQHLLSYIADSFSNGRTAIYYDSLYKEFQIEFQGQRINNTDMLKTYLSYINDGSYVINRSYLAFDCSVEVDPTDEVRDYLINLGMPMYIEDLLEALSNIPRDKIIGALAGSNSAEFVRNQKGEYFHANIVDLTTAELDNITNIIKQAIDEKDFIGGNELVEIISIRYPSIIERYPYLTQLGIRNAIGYKLRNVFSFKGKIISLLGKNISMSDVFAYYAKSHEHFTLTQLNALKTDLDTSIYFDSVYNNSIRISKEDFISKGRANFDIDATDAAIDRFCTNEYITIQEIYSFASFPYAGFPWNGFFLEHYVSAYSKKYKLMHAGFNASTTAGAIVKCSARFENFDELIASALADGTISLNKQDALEYLCEKGFLARRSYGDIDEILVKANMQRLKRG